MPKFARLRSRSASNPREGQEILSIEELRALSGEEGQVSQDLANQSEVSPPPEASETGSDGVIAQILQANEELQKQLTRAIGELNKRATPPEPILAKPKNYPKDFRHLIQEVLDPKLKNFLSELDVDSKNSILSDADVRATIKDPQGGLIFESWVRAKQNSCENTPPSNKEMIRACKDYIKGKNKVLGEISAKIKPTLVNDLTSYIDRKFTPGMFGSLQPIKADLGVNPPTSFATGVDHTHYSDYRTQTIYKAFDTSKVFSGKGGRTIRTWLQELNARQEQLKLTEEEFKEFMLRTSVGQANALVSSYIDQKCSLYEIYSRLLKQYEQSLTPTLASERSKSYKATKDNSLMGTITEIEILVSAMSKKFKHKEGALNFFNVTAPDVLIESLPVYSRQTVSHIFESMTIVNVEPKWTDFVQCLEPYHNSINRDIASNGFNPGFNGIIEIPGGEGKNDDQNYSRPASNPFYKPINNNRSVRQLNEQIGSHPVLYTYPPPSLANNSASVQAVNQSHSLSLPGRKHCGHCLKNNHFATDGCYAIFSDDGRQLSQGLTSGPCPSCISKINKNMHHPESLCPLRDAAIELYKTKKVAPIGLFAKYFREQYPSFAKQYERKTFKKQNQNKSESNSNVQQLNVPEDINYSVLMLKANTLPDPRYSWKPEDYQGTIKFMNTKKPSGPRKLYLNGLLEVNSRNFDKFSAMIDTGSDINLISRSYLGRLFDLAPDGVEEIVRPSNLKITTYTQDQVQITGEMNICIKLNETDIGTTLKFYVVCDINQSVTAMIIGLKGMGELGLNIIHCRENNEIIPKLHHKKPKVNVESLYLSESGLQEVQSSIINLKPQEEKFVHFYFPHFFNIAQNDSIILSDDFVPFPLLNKSVSILPTRSVIKMDENCKYLYGIGYVKNNSNSFLTNFQLHGSAELGANYEFHEIDATKLQDLEHTYFVHEIRGFSLDSELQDYSSYHFEHYKAPEKSINNKVESIESYFPDDPKYYADPKTINNGQENKNLAVSEERNNLDNILNSKEIPQEELHYFTNPETSVQMGQITYADNYEVEKDLMEPRGYSIPLDQCLDLETIIDIDKFDEPIKSHIKRIFIDKYSKVVARHSVDKGCLSKTLGKYEIKLKPNAVLPSFNKVYYVSQMERLQMHSILSFLVQNGTIEKTPVTGDDHHNFASPAYIISRKSPSSCPRLIINFKNINDLIQAEAVNLPTVDSMIQGLRDAYFYSSSDLTNAYHSVEISDSSKDYTIFSCELGSFRHKSLPVGIKVSPESLNRFVHKMIHHKVKFDKGGKPLYNSDGTVVLEYDPIPECYSIYDDLLIFSRPKATYIEGVKHHFEIVEKIMSRLAFHNAKISFAKSTFCQQRVNFFGFFIQNNACIVDPNRVKKLIETPIFNSPKGARSFLGLLNSFRQHLSFETLQYVPILSPLTSSKLRHFTPTQEQITAFEKLKQSLTSAPLYSKIICTQAPKIIFADMSGGENALYSGILGQIIIPKADKPYVPEYLCLDDPTHQLIYDHRYKIRPLPLKPDDQPIKDYKKLLSSDKPIDFSYVHQPLYGYSENNVASSVQTSLKLLLELNNISLSYEHICQNIKTEISKTIFRQQYLDFICNKDPTSLKSLLHEFGLGKLTIDKHFFIFDLISKVTARPVVVLSKTSLKPQFLEFNSDKSKPPLVFLVREIKGQLICRPAIFDKSEVYKLRDHIGTFEICSYISKTMSKNYSHLHILDRELTALLFVLKSFSKLIGNSETILVTDCRPLFYLFSNCVLDNSTKLSRWNYSIFEEYPNIKLRFIKSEDNIADFMTRNFSLQKPLPKIPLPKYVSSELADNIPDKTFSLDEWKDFVNQNQQYLLDLKKENTAAVNVLKSQNDMVKLILNPLETLQDLFNITNIKQKQNIEFKDIHDKCLTAQNMTVQDKRFKYSLKNGIICIEKNNKLQILAPTELLPSMIAFAHLKAGHQGINKMLLTLADYYHPNMRKKVKAYARSCYACQVCNSPTHLEKFGLYTTPSKPFEVCHMDLIEGLPKYQNYQHILTVTDYLTGTLLCFPLRGKTAGEYLTVFLNNIYMAYAPKYLLLDQGSNFMQKDNLKYLASLNTHVLHATSHWSQAKGYVESMNKVIKTSLIKYLHDSKKHNWVAALPLLVRLFNTTPQVRSQYTPYQLLYGPHSQAASDNFTFINTKQIHPSIKGSEKSILKGHQELEDLLKYVQEKLQIEREARIAKFNLTRTESNFQVNELVLVKNYSRFEGENTTLRPKFHLVPFKVLETSPVSSVVCRLTDHMVQKLSNNDIKRYSPLDSDFAHLPESILNTLSKRFELLTEEQIKDLMLIDDFRLVKPTPSSEPNNQPTTDEKPENSSISSSSSEESEDDDLEQGYNLRNRKVTFANNTKQN